MLRQLLRREARPSANMPARPRIEDALDRQAAQRHRRIAESSPYTAPTIPPMPSGFRAEDVVGSHVDGFVPLRDAATRMKTSEEAIVDLVARGLLEVDDRGHVRPAIVSILAVSRP